LGGRVIWGKNGGGQVRRDWLGEGGRRAGEEESGGRREEGR